MDEESVDDDGDGIDGNCDEKRELESGTSGNIHVKVQFLFSV